MFALDAITANTNANKRQILQDVQYFFFFLGGRVGGKRRTKYYNVFSIRGHLNNYLEPQHLKYKRHHKTVSLRAINPITKQNNGEKLETTKSKKLEDCTQGISKASNSNG